MITKRFDIVRGFIRVALVVLLVAGGVLDASAQGQIVKRNTQKPVQSTGQKSRTSITQKKKRGYGYGQQYIAPKPAAPKTASQKYTQGEAYFNQGKYSEAFNMFKQSAEQGNPRAQYRLAECYESGTGTQRNMGQAMEWYQAAYENDDMQMQSQAEDAINRNEAAFAESFDEGVEFYNSEEYEYAFIIFEELAESGYAAANNMVGQCYAAGQGCQQSNTQAFKYYTRAAEGGDDDGQYNLGMCYLEGSGTYRDTDKALELFRLAANNENADAECALGQCYEQGIGVDPDRNTAILYYRKAAGRGDEDAQSALRRMGVDL